MMAARTRTNLLRAAAVATTAAAAAAGAATTSSEFLVPSQQVGSVNSPSPSPQTIAFQRQESSDLRAWSESEAQRNQQRRPGVEILVHNLSHADLIVKLAQPHGDGDGRELKARPMFNQFRTIGEAILGFMRTAESKGRSVKVVECTSTYQIRYPIGIDLTYGKAEHGVTVSSSKQEGGGREGAAINNPWERFHLKGFKRHDGQTPALPEVQQGLPVITAALLPLLAILVPQWLKVVRKRQKENELPPRQVVVLLGGSGQPRDATAEPLDNSTESTARIAKAFLNAVYPQIEVVIISSGGERGMFRYDDNVNFVKDQVLPVIEAHRTRVVEEHGEDWGKRLNITLSLSDGAPARIAALNASLRSYRPNYLHLWRLKTYWDTDRISESDVDFHTFNKLEMRPATPRLQLRGEELGLVNEMLSYKRQFEAVREATHKSLDGGDVGNAPELASFWLRKTKKAVLAVLLTKKKDGDATFYRGMNVEVSMPTGTLCAERNAIGNALAADQTLKRNEIHAVAVLSISLQPDLHPVSSDEEEEAAETALNPLDPCGACMEWLRKIAEVNPDFKVISFNDTSCNKVYITGVDYWQ